MSVSAMNLRVAVLGVLLVLWAGHAWCQNLAIFPKEDMLLIGGDFRLRSVYSNMGAANDAGGGESGGFPVADSATKSFFDTRLRLYWDFRPSDLMRIHYRMEIGDIRFGGCDDSDPDCETGSDVSGNLVPVIGPGAGGGVGADGVNVETKNIFMEAEVPLIRGLSFRGGIFGYGDRYDFNILADDFAGLQLRYRRRDVSAHLVYLKFFEGDTRDNADDSDWIGMDAEYRLSPSTMVGGSFHYWTDQGNKGDLEVTPFQYWAGLEVTSRVGPALLNGYAIVNQGEGYYGRRVGKNSGLNASVSGDYFMPFGTVGLQAQYISGEAGSKAELENGGGSQDADIGAWLSYKNHMYQGPAIISRGPIIDIGDGFNSKWGTGNGYFNGDYNGRYLLIARGAFPVLQSLYRDAVTLHVAGAYDLAAAENANGDSDRGIELDVWAHVNLMPKLWMRFGGAYYVTGAWWNGNTDASFDGYGEGIGTPAGFEADDIWQISVRLQYDFG